MEPGTKRVTAARSPRPRPGSRLAGFSLIELLVVMAILGILLALAVPPAGQMMRASGLANAGDQVLGHLSQARQMATSRNRTVEVRFYRYRDPNEPADPPDGQFRGLQLFVVEPSPQGSSTNALGRPQILPRSTSIAPTDTLSSLLNPATTPRKTGAELGQPLSPCGLNYEAAILRFYPDGSTSLPSGQLHFLTVVPATTASDTGVPPDNHATIVLQPDSGKAQLHRP